MSLLKDYTNGCIMFVAYEHHKIIALDDEVINFVYGPLNNSVIK